MKSQNPNVDDLPRLAAPARCALASAGISRLTQLTIFSEDEIARWHGIGPNALTQLKRALKAKGMSFANEKSKESLKITASKNNPAASQLLADRIAELGDWRGKTLAELRTVILSTPPDITEDCKCGSPVWSHTGLICSGGTFKDHVKVHFFHGAFLKDPKHLFNAGLDAKGMRAIDFREGDKVNASALKALVREAIAYNVASQKK